MTLVDVHLTARPCVALQTLTVEGAICIHTLSCMLTGVTVGHGTLIDVFCAVSALVALWAGANVLPIQGVGVTQRPLVTRVADTGIVQVTQETCLSLRTKAGEGGHTVNAGGPWRAGGEGTVIDVLAAVIPTPAVHTHAAIASVAVGASASILTSIGLQQTLIHVFCAELPGPLRGAAAVVSIDAIHTHPSILTLVVRAVVDIPLTGAPFKPWQAIAFKSEVSSLTAGASVDTGRGCTGHIRAVTVLAGEALRALASVGTRKVEAGATMLAASWNVTLIDISFTLLPCDACRTPAGELVGHRGTGASIFAGMRQTGICPLTLLSCEAHLAGALVGVPAEHVAGASILTGAGHKAGVRGRVLAVLPCEPWSTSAGGFPQHGLRHTSTTILTAVFLTGVSMLTIFSQEALWTSAVARAVVVGNTGPFIYTGLLTTSTLQSVRRARAA